MTYPFSALRRGTKFRHDGAVFVKTGPTTARPFGTETEVTLAADQPVTWPTTVKQSRPDRWQAACAAARTALEEAEPIKEDLTDLEQEADDMEDEESETGEARRASIEAKQADLEAVMQKAVDAFGELRDLQSEYEAWKDSLPESLAESAVGEKLDAVTELDLEAATDDEIEDLISKLDEADGADLPRGFGQD
jgi:hypothetical protein